MTRAGAAGIVTVAVTIASVGLSLIATRDDADAWLAPALLYTAVAFSFVAAGIVAARRRPENRTGALLVATGFTWFTGFLGVSDSDVVFTVSALLSSVPYALIVVLALSYPTATLPWRPDRLLVGAAIGLVTVGQALFLLVATTEDLCDEEASCGDNLLFVTDARVPSLIDRWALNTLILVTVAAAIWRMAARWREASPALRRVVGPVYLAASGSFASVALRIAVEDVSRDVATVFAVVQIASLLGIPLALLFGLLRSRLARGAVAQLAVALGAGHPLREALARALGDPSLTIAYPLPGTGWIDADGHVVPEPASTDLTVATPVRRDGQVIASLIHDRALADEPELVEGVAAAAALALQAEGLQAEAKAQFTFLVTLVNTAPSLFVHIGTDGRIRNQNAVAVEVVGVPDEEQIRGRFFWDVFVSPEERADVIDRFEASKPSFAAGEYENTFVNQRGERRVIFWRAAPVSAENGEVTGIIAAGVDITARHEEIEARERERIFLNAIANNAPSLLCLIDEAGVLAPFASNKTFERMLEYEPEETGGHVFWERYVAAEDADEVRTVILEVAAGGPVTETDSTWVTRTGRQLSVSWSCTPLPAIDDRRLLLVSGIDVTLRKHRELELQRERDATTTVLEAISSMTVVLDRDGIIRDRDVDNPRAAVNRAFRETFRWRDEHLVGRHLLDLVIEDDDAPAREALEAAARGEQSPQVESRWLRADGVAVHVAWNASPVSDVTGRTDGLVLVSGVDVTDRRARELEDERRRAFVDAVTNTIPSFLLAVKPDGTVRESGINRAFAEAFGWTADEIEGECFFGAVTAENDTTARIAIANAARGIEQGEIESRWDERGGDSRIVAWSASPVTSVHGELLVLVTGTDVTVRRLQEEELRASRARLVTAADEARRRLERNLHDGAQQRLVALSVSLRLAESKLASGAEDVLPLLVALREELGIALEELRELARGIHPAVLTDRGLGPALDALAARAPLPVELVVDVEDIPPAAEAAAYYVVAEGLTNVVKYAHATMARVEVLATDSTLVVSVRDDGVGGANPSSGTGLRGLEDRVAALDGRLVVETLPDAGTCIRAEIPLRRSSAVGS